MKFKKSLLPILAAGTTALTATPTLGQSNNNVVFRCNANQDTPTTVVYNSKTQKETPLILWKQEYIDSQNIRASCADAANKFQRRYNNKDKLDFLAIDNNSKNQIVVCLINERGDSCNLKSSDELFRIKTTDKNQDFDKTLSTIIEPNLGKVDVNQSPIRTLARIYPRINFRIIYLSREWLV